MTTDVAHLSHDDIKTLDIVYDKLIHLDTTEGNRTVTISLSDGTIRMGLRHAILHVFFWNIYFAIDPDSKITVDKIFMPKAINDDEIARILTLILNDIRKETSLVDNRELISDALYRCINDLYNFISTELNAYVGTLDIISILKLMKNEKIVKAKDFKYNELFGTYLVEKQIANAGSEILKLLGDENEIPIKDNCLYWSIKTGQINPLQLTQMMVAYGPRTDIDDTIIRYPILDNAIEGLQNIWEVSIESLAAKKSAVYNKLNVPTSQYLNRKQQLLCSSITSIYPGDCGNRFTYPFEVTRETVESILGMNMIDEDGEIVKLTQEKLDELPNGGVINIINPTTCRHTDGVCYHCGGDILKNINPRLNLGMHFASLAIRRFTQKILSNKHHNKTSTIEYRIPVESSEYLEQQNAQKVGWNKGIVGQISKMRMGIYHKDISEIQDIIVADFTKDLRYKLVDEHYVEEETTRKGRMKKSISEEKYTSLSGVKLHNMNNGDIKYLPLDCDGLKPFLTFEMLYHVQNFLKANPIVYDDDGYIWIPLKGTERIPIFSSLIINDSIKKFVETIRQFLEKNIGGITSINDAVHQFKSLIHAKEKSVHMTIICTMLKAYLVTDSHNYRIPVVTDPEKVMFRPAPDLITKRTVSTELGFQGLMKYLTYPDTYLYPKSRSVLDIFFGI